MSVTTTVEPIVHHRALARLKDNQSQSNRLKEKSARAQCQIANGGVPCDCGPVPAPPGPIVKPPKPVVPYVSRAQQRIDRALHIEQQSTNDCITLMEEAKACLTKEGQPLAALEDLKSNMVRLLGALSKGS